MILDHIHLDTFTCYKFSERVVIPSQRPLPTKHTTNTREENPCPQWGTRDSSKQSGSDLRLSPGHRVRRSFSSARLIQSWN